MAVACFSEPRLQVIDHLIRSMVQIVQVLFVEPVHLMFLDTGKLPTNLVIVSVYMGTCLLLQK